MKNRLLTRFPRPPFWGLIFLLWFGLSACGGLVEGKIYFDENGNGMMDANEIGTPYAKISIMKDGKLHKEGFTKPDGSFSFRKEKGVYYLKVDLSSIDYDRARTSGSAYVAAEDVDVKGQLSKGLWGEDDEAGDAGEDQGSDSGDSDEGSSEGESQALSEPGEGYEGYVQNVGHRIVSTSDFTNITGVLIPVAFDRESSLSQAPAPVTQTCYVGETCEVRINSFYGCNCHVNLPSDLSVDSSSSGWRHDAGVGTAIHSGTSAGSVGSLSASAGSSSISPAVSILSLPISVANEAEPRDVKLQPIIRCPDGEVRHSPVTIKLVRDLSPVTIVSYSGEQKSEGSGVFTIEVKQEGKSRLEGYVVLTFGGDDLPQIMNPYECKNTGGGAICEVAGLAAGQKKIFNIRVKMPKAEGSNLEVTASAAFKSKHLDSDDGIRSLTDVTLNIPGA